MIGNQRPRRLAVIGVLSVVAVVGAIAVDGNADRGAQPGLARSAGAAAGPSLAARSLSSPGQSNPRHQVKLSTASSAPRRPVSTAIGLLSTLSIKGRAPKTGYSRAQFGSAWTDDNNAPGGHNGCDTRNDILARDLTNIAFKPGTNGCVALTGTLAEPYTGLTITFARGAATSALVQIDHVVALSDAWQKGAQQLSAADRIDLANDPLELLAVDGPTNEAKSDGDAATWLPPNKGYRCAYVARQIAVKARYHLWVTAAEHDAMTRVLVSCPDQPVPAAADGPTPESLRTSTHAPTQRSTAAAAATHRANYQNCAAVRAAGKAPLLRGQPGYAAHLDGDGDGVACES